MNQEFNGLKQITFTKLLSDPMAINEMDIILRTEKVLSYISTSTADIINYLNDDNALVTVSYEAKQKGILRTIIFAKLPTE